MGTTLIIATILITFFINNYKQKKMGQKLDTLTAQVAETKTVIGSAVTLIGGLKTRLDAAISAQQNGDDGAALDALSNDLAANTDTLAAAITANTPADMTTQP